MRVTKKSLVIKIDPDDWRQGQWVGEEYYWLTDLNNVFGPHNWATMDEDGYDLGVYPIPNRDIIRHCVRPYRRVGYIVQ